MLHQNALCVTARSVPGVVRAEFWPEVAFSLAVDKVRCGGYEGAIVVVITVVFFIGREPGNLKGFELVC